MADVCRIFHIYDTLQDRLIDYSDRLQDEMSCFDTWVADI